MGEKNYQAITVGTSLGGFRALEVILLGLPRGFGVPILIVQHLDPNSDGLVPSLLSEKCAIRIKEADDKEAIESGTVYVAPPNYHLLVEPDRTLSLSIDEKENYSRPSIDVLFESAAEAYKGSLIGIVLTGASHDGARGLEKIKAMGGLTIVQDPETAESRIMPVAAIRQAKADYILPLPEITDFIVRCCEGEGTIV